MTNEQWFNELNTQAKAVIFFQLVVMKPSDINKEFGVAGGGQFQQDWINWLRAERPTTGHEDLINAGWQLYESDMEEEIILYRKGDKEFEINTTKLGFQFAETTCNFIQFIDSEIDFLRKCAEKIRKEKGWNE